MSALSTPDPEGAEAFYGTVLRAAEALAAWGDVGRLDVLRLQLACGGEPQQPVPRDVVAVMMPGERAAWNAGFWIEDVDVAAERAAWPSAAR